MKKKITNKISTVFLSEEELKKLAKAADEGNIPAKLHIINHNQRVILDKLAKLIKLNNK